MGIGMIVGSTIAVIIMRGIKYRGSKLYFLPKNSYNTVKRVKDGEKTKN